jgi:hypothetical protein
MFMGWQHCWVVIAAHPSMAGLQQGSELLSRVGAVVPWQIVAAIAAVAATAISIRRQIAKEKASIRWAVLSYRRFAGEACCRAASASIPVLIHNTAQQS